MPKLLLSLLIMLSSALTMSAQWGKATNLTLKHNIPDNNGRQMLQVHFNMEVHNANGHKIIPAVFVDIPAGTSHYFSDGRQMKQDGVTYTSNYEHCYWNELQWIGIYNDCLNLKPGKNTYYIRIGIWDRDLGRWINDWNNTPWISCEMTGATASQSQGIVVPYVPALPQHNQCGVCYSTGRCSFCKGSGIGRNHAPGVIVKCGACGGNGRCITCGGRGWY